MNKKYLKAIIIFSLIGMALALLLTVQHYSLIRVGFEEKSFCSINEWIDCDTVNASSYASLFSVPVSGLGFLFFFVVFIYSAIAHASHAHKKDGLLFCFYLSFSALIFSLYLGYISFFKLAKMCLLCTSMNLFVLLIFLFIPLAIRIRFRDLPALTVQYLKSSLKLKSTLGLEPRTAMHAGIVGTLYLVGMFILFNVSEGLTSHGPKRNIDRFVAAYFAQMPIKIIPGDRPLWGNPKASVTIVEFSDFQCPFCRVAAVNIKPSLAEYKNDVAFYFVNYPLDNTCNREMTRQMHPNACLAAKAALCAHGEGKFWQYHDLAFDSQRNLSRVKLIEMAESLGLKKESFSACIDSPEMDQRIQEDIELAKQLEVSGTPSVFVNGRRLNAWRDRDILRHVVDEELKRVKH